MTSEVGKIHQNKQRRWHAIWNEMISGIVGFAAPSGGVYSSGMSDFAALESRLSALRIEMRDAEVERLQSKLDVVRLVLNDGERTAEERLAWLRDYLGQST